MWHLGYKLGVIEQEIFKDHNLIEVDMILHSYTSVGEGV